MWEPPNTIRLLVSHNWAHDCNRQGMRFDYHGSGIRRQDGQLFGDGVYMNNVTWNTTDNEVKGDRQSHFEQYRSEQ